MKKRLFKIVLIIASIVVLASLTGCNTNNIDVSNNIEEKEKETAKYVQFENMYVDNSYVDKDNENLKMVYVFTNVSTNDKNLQVNSENMDIIINDINTYEAKRYLDVEKNFVSNYYYSKYIEDVYAGTSLKVMQTFKIPQADLNGGKSIKLQSNNYPNDLPIFLTTDEIKFCDNFEEIAKSVDLEGYTKEQEKRQEANAELVSRVKKEINGYEWSFYINSTYYKISFENPNEFYVTALGNTNSGNYSIKNGYIYCTYPSNNKTIKIPYDFEENGEIALYLVEAFDVIG